MVAWPTGLSADLLKQYKMEYRLADFVMMHTVDGCSLRSGRRSKPVSNVVVWRSTVSERLECLTDFEGIECVRFRNLSFMS